MNKIPDKYRDLLDRPIVVSLATLMSDGPPQVQPVWCSFDGTHTLVNTEKVARNTATCRTDRR
jgi:Pyridoxamine 5'-phosphate oxidase